MQNQTRNLAIAALIAVVVVVTCWNQSTGQGEAAKPAPVKWEYLVTSDFDTESLNRRATSGWEVCAAYSTARNGGNTIGNVILRRSKTTP